MYSVQAVVRTLKNKGGGVLIEGIYEDGTEGVIGVKMD